MLTGVVTPEEYVALVQSTDIKPTAVAADAAELATILAELGHSEPVSPAAA